MMNGNTNDDMFLSDEYEDMVLTRGQFHKLMWNLANESKKAGKLAGKYISSDITKAKYYEGKSTAYYKVLIALEKYDI